MIRKTRKGFTLIELIVVLILMGVITTMLVMIMKPTRKHYESITNRSGEETAAITIGDVLNGSLRYATGVKLICNDGTAPTVAEIDEYQHYFKISNDYRKGSKKGARGYIERGDFERVSGTLVPSGNLTPVSSVANSEIFEEYDFQFVVSADRTPNNQSMSVKMTACPMRLATETEITAATALKNGMPDGTPAKSIINVDFAPDTDKIYNYTETFQFVNMRQTIGVRKLPFDIDTYDPQPSGTDNTFWILFERPQEAVTGTTTTTSDTGTGSSSSSSSSSVSAPLATTPTPTPPTPGVTSQITTDSNYVPTASFQLPNFNEDVKSTIQNGKVVKEVNFRLNHMMAEVVVEADGREAAFDIFIDQFGSYNITISNNGFYTDGISDCFDSSVFPGAAPGKNYVLTDAMKEWLKNAYDVHPWNKDDHASYGYSSATQSSAPETTPSESETQPPESTPEGETSSETTTTTVTTTTPTTTTPASSSLATTTTQGSGPLSITIHYSRTQRVDHGSGNEWYWNHVYTDGYVVDGQSGDGWKRTTSSSSVTVNPGSNLNISLYDQNYSYIKTLSLTYDNLKATKDVWIRYDSIDTSRPADWAD